MKIIYSLSEQDIRNILIEYMKREYNMENPNVILKKEIQEGYGPYQGENEVIVAKVTEF